METFEALGRARAQFDQRVRSVAADQWDAPTPCEGWTVRDLVHHVVGANRMAELLLDGGARHEAIAVMASDVLGSDPVAAFRASADRQEAAFRRPGALDRTCHHPIGDIPGSQLIGFRIADLTLHAWDLARAIGADERLDPELVAAVWAAMEPMGEFIAALGLFGSGPSGELDDDAGTQDRLLDLAGRRP